MNHENRRSQFRRYSDRRILALLELHEVLFYHPPGVERDVKLLKTISADYGTDRVWLVQSHGEQNDTVSIICACDEQVLAGATPIRRGPGIAALRRNHEKFEGALTLSKFRNSSAFSTSEWQSLWDVDLEQSVAALLSVPFFPKLGPSGFLWLMLDSGSREWSSHDRDLAEEESLLIAQMIDKKMIAAPGE